MPNERRPSGRDHHFPPQREVADALHQASRPAQSGLELAAIGMASALAGYGVGVLLGNLLLS